MKQTNREFKRIRHKYDKLSVRGSIFWGSLPYNVYMVNVSYAFSNIVKEHGYTRGRRINIRYKRRLKFKRKLAAIHN